MKGKRAKAIRKYVATLGADSAEEQYVARQVKAGRRYLDFFDDATYRQVVLDRVTGERHFGVIAPRLKAVKL